MIDINEFQDFSRLTLKTYLERNGIILNSSIETLTKGRYYIIGQNPGGSELSGNTIENSIADMATYKENAYIDEAWSNYDKGQHPVQKGLQAISILLGYSLRQICASNLIFYRTKDETDIKFSDAKICWQVHNKILEIVQPEIIISFGVGPKSPFNFISDFFKAKPIDSFDTNHKNYFVKISEIDFDNNKFLLIGIPHLSRYTIEHDERILDLIKTKVDNYTLNEININIEKEELDRQVYLTLNSIQETKQINLVKISNASNQLRSLEDLEIKFSYASDILKNINPSTENRKEINNLIFKPIRNLNRSGLIIDSNLNLLKFNNKFDERNNELLKYTDSTSANYAYSIHTNMISNPNLVKNEEEIFHKYQIEDFLKNNIDYILENVGSIEPSYTIDFKNFISKYYAFEEDESKYQDFIALRSMIFMKIIFGFSESAGITKENGKSRRDQIKYFVLGNQPEDSITGLAIQEAKILYNKLSDQSPQSIKMGNIDISEIKNQFRTFINVFSDLLKLRNLYFP